MIEEWRNVVGYEKSYQVSNFGRVRSKDRIDSNGHKRKGKIRKETINRDGYQLVNLCQEGKVKYITVHRLVARAFLPNPDNKPQVNHIDGNKTNNHLTNLEWATISENVIHAINNGLIKSRGKDNCKAKLTDEQIVKIRLLRKTNKKKYTYKKLGEMFGVTSANVCDIVNMNTWKHIKKDFTAKVI